MPEQHPKRPVSELKPDELRTIVGESQKLLWLDTVRRHITPGRPPSMRTSGTATRNSRTTPSITSRGTRRPRTPPHRPPTVTGFKSVDEFTRHIAEHFPLPEPPTADDTDDEIEPS